MENQNTESQTPNTVPTPNTLPVQMPVQKNNNAVIFVLCLLVAILVGVSAYFYQQTIDLKKDLTIQPSPTPTKSSEESTLPISSPTNLMSDWLTYTSPFKTTIKYPSDWKLEPKYIKDDTSVTEKLFSFTLSRGLYSITISYPDGFGPGICIFQDQPAYIQDLEPNPVSSKCEGEFVEIKGNSLTFRHLAMPPRPLEDGKAAEWGVYTKDKSGNFVTIPPIAYKVPAKYDTKIVEVMDQILATYDLIK